MGWGNFQVVGWGFQFTKDFVGASQKPCAELWALSLQVFQSYSLLTSCNDVVMSLHISSDCSVADVSHLIFFGVCGYEFTAIILLSTSLL